MRYLSGLAGQWLRSQLPAEEGEARTVALHASSSLVYLLVALGWIRAGYKVILVS